MSVSPQKQTAAIPSPPRKVFNWADEDDDASSDGDAPPEQVVMNRQSPIAIPSTSPALVPAVSTLTPTNRDLSKTTPTLEGRREGDHDDGTTKAREAEDSAVRELLAAAALTPSRHSQEVTIQAAIPYKLKSVWNATTGGGGGNSPASVRIAESSATTTPARPSVGTVAALGSASRGTTVAGSSLHLASSSGSGAVGGAPRPLRMNRAVDELTSVLRANDGSLPYDELMVKAQWRSRFQPSFGSLFTFLKRNKDIFHYQQSVVELVKEGSIVAELLKMQWGNSSAVEVNARICGYGGAIVPETEEGGGKKTLPLSPNTAKHGAIGSKDTSPVASTGGRF